MLLELVGEDNTPTEPLEVETFSVLLLLPPSPALVEVLKLRCTFCTPLPFAALPAVEMAKDVTAGGDSRDKSAVGRESGEGEALARRCPPLSGDS